MNFVRILHVLQTIRTFERTLAPHRSRLSVTLVHTMVLTLYTLRGTRYFTVLTTRVHNLKSVQLPAQPLYSAATAEFNKTLCGSKRYADEQAAESDNKRVELNAGLCTVTLYLSCT